MNINLRAKLSGYSQTSLERVDAAVQAANSAADNANAVAEALVEAKNAGEFNGSQGQQGVQGVQGLPGPQGISITSISFVTTAGVITSGTATFSNGTTSPITFLVEEGE